MLANVDHALGHNVLHVDALLDYALADDLDDARNVAVIHAQDHFVVALKIFEISKIIYISVKHKKKITHTSRQSRTGSRRCAASPRSHRRRAAS
jgi:hypothetical protein